MSTEAEVLAINEGWDISLRLGSVTLPPGVPVRVPLSYISSYGNTKGVRFDFSPVSEYLRTRTEDGRPVIDFWGPMSVVDGYGRHALDIHRGLRLLGVEASYSASEYVDTQWLDPGLLQAARRSKYTTPSKVSVAMSVPYDPIIGGGSSVVKLAITQFETDRVPAQHVSIVNRCDHLICTSSFQPDIWKSSGLNIPISVMTSGVDTDFFLEVDRKMTSEFRVLILGALTPRKNTEGAIRIFQEASEGNPDWRLTVKSRGYISPDVERMIAGDSRVNLIFGDWPPDAVRDQLYYQHDCFLWPSKGEGVGLPPLEAMSTGMELVCSDNSGMKDYVGDGWCYPIRMSGMIDADAPGECFSPEYMPGYVSKFGKPGRYWNPNHGHAVRQLRRCFSNWLSGKGKGGKAAQYVRSHHTLLDQADSVLQVVESYL